MGNDEPSHRDLLAEGFHAIVDAHMGKDIAAIITSAAAIDATMEALLRKHLRRCKQTDRLLDPLGGGALSSFGARADMLFALGFLDEHNHQTAKQLAKIRNLAAHGLTKDGFSDPKIQKKCLALPVPKDRPLINGRPLDLPPDTPAATRAHARFWECANVLWSYLSWRVNLPVLR